MAKKTIVAKPNFEVELAPRSLDLYEYDYLGLIGPNDPLLKERGENIEVYRNLKRDGRVFGCLQKRIGALVGRPWSVEAVEEKHSAHAEVVTKILKQINFDQVCRDLMDAILMGYSISEIVWGVVGGLVVPIRIPKRRQRRFVYREIETLVLCLLTREQPLTGIPLPDRKFIVHRVNPEDDNPYGTGLGLQLFWPVYFKRRGVISWNKLCDRFGTPTPWGKYGSNTNPRDKQTLADALKAMSNDGYIMTPDKMQVELIESKLSGNVTTHEALVAKMDEWIAEIVIGQEHNGEAGGAVAAASKERSAVRLDLVQADSDLLSETLNSTLIKWICEYNGLAPCLIYRQIKEEEDLKVSSETDKNVYEMGFEPSEEYIRSKYGEGWQKRGGVPSANQGSSSTNEGGEQQETAGNSEANKFDAGMINAYSMGVERFTRLGVDVPENFIRTIFNIPRPKPGEKILVPQQEPAPGPASFSEPGEEDDPDQVAIENAIADLSEDELQAVMEKLIQPLFKAVDGAKSFEEALAAAATALPEMDTTALQSLLARAMFGAELYGRAGNV